MAIQFPSLAPPTFVFPPRRVNTVGNGDVLERFCIRWRFVPHVSSLKTMLIYTRGYCTGRCKYTSHSGWAFVFNDSSTGTVSGPVKNEGPDGQVRKQRLGQAEIRAVIEALKFRVWWAEGWTRVVIATPSDYVADGATKNIHSWHCQGWCFPSGDPRPDRDLWQALSDVLGLYSESGCEVSIWLSARRFNWRGYTTAKNAAIAGNNPKKYFDLQVRQV